MPADPGQGQAEAGLDVGLALLLPAGPGQPERAAQLGQPLLGVAEVPQRDAGRLARHGGLGGSGRRPAGQQRPRPGQRLGGPRVHESEKMTCLVGI
jgi:hypothetical protein